MTPEAPQSDSTEPISAGSVPAQPACAHSESIRSSGPRSRSTLSRGICGLLPLSSLLLAFQASAPLSGSWHAPSFINWFLLALLCVGAMDQFRRGDAVTRFAVSVLLTAVLHLLTITDWFQVISTDHLGSMLSAHLSETWKGMPLAALFQAWSALCAGFLCHQCVTQIQHLPPKPVSLVAIALSSFTALVGVRAVIGYASGNTSLIAW